MRITILVLAIFFSLVFPLTAQINPNFSLEWGDLIKQKEFTHAIKILDAGDKGIFTISTEYKVISDLAQSIGSTSLEPEAYSISHFDNNLKELNTLLIYKYKKKQNFDLHDAFVINNEVYLLMRDHHELAIFHVKPQTLELLKIHSLFSTENNRGYYTNARACVSPNKKELLIYFRHYKNKQTNAQYYFEVFNPEFNTLWKNEVNWTMASGHAFREEQVAFTNEGLVYFVSSNIPNGDIAPASVKNIFNSLAEENENEPNKNYFISIIQKGSVAEQGTQIKLDGKQILSMAFDVNTAGDPICAGLAKSNSDYGIYFMKLSKDGQSNRVSEFKSSDLQSLLKAGMTNLGDFDLSPEARLRRFKVNLIQKTNGAYYLIAEESLYSKTVFVGQSTTNNRNHYQKGQLFISAISAEGKIEWLKDLYKRQHSTSLQVSYNFHSSYAGFLKENDLYLLYNGHPETTSLNPPAQAKPMQNKKSSTLYIVKLSEEGKLSKSQLFNAKAEKKYAAPKTFAQTDNGDIIFMNEWPISQQPGKLKIK